MSQRAHVLQSIHSTAGHIPSVIIVEDEPLVALAMEEEFAAARFNVAGSFASCAETFGWLERHQPDVAVLDVVLKDGPCYDLALELKRRGVPFLICSAAERNCEPPELAEVPRLSKPAPFADIVGRVRNLLPKSPASSWPLF